MDGTTSSARCDLFSAPSLILNYAKVAGGQGYPEASSISWLVFLPLSCTFYSHGEVLQISALEVFPGPIKSECLGVGARHRCVLKILG